MSPETSTLKASQAVERIREIIVGRHLEKLEQRVSRLEASGKPVASHPEFDERLLLVEARVEAMHDNVARLTDHTREELERRGYLHREEVHRLARQIQEVAASRPPVMDSGPAMQQLEQKLGTWLGSWKSAFQQHLDGRDQQISSHIQTELKTLGSSVDERLSRLEAKLPDTKAIEQRFMRIANAARALAESASQLPPLPTAIIPP